MSNQNQQLDPRMTASVVYQLPYTGEICTNVPYSDDDALVMDIYYPQVRADSIPAIVLVTGFPDSGYQSRMGMKQKEVMWYVSWAKLLAASGFVAITYSNRNPGQDIFTLLEFLRDSEVDGTVVKENTDRVVSGIDRKRTGILSMSGNVSNAVSVLMSDMPINCAAFLYGYTMDIADSSLVAEAAELYGFTKPDEAGSAFPDKVPMFIARAGKDENSGLNTSLDRFVDAALKCNAPVSLMNYPDGKHCFDILDASGESVGIIKMILAFYRYHLMN